MVPDLRHGKEAVGRTFCCNLWYSDSWSQDKIIGMTPPTAILLAVFPSGKFSCKTQRVPKESFSEASNELLAVTMLKYAERAKPEKEKSLWYPLLIINPDF